MVPPHLASKHSVGILWQNKKRSLREPADGGPKLTHTAGCVPLLSSKKLFSTNRTKTEQFRNTVWRGMMPYTHNFLGLKLDALHGLDVRTHVQVKVQPRNCLCHRPRTDLPGWMGYTTWGSEIVFAAYIPFSFHCIVKHVHFRPLGLTERGSKIIIESLLRKPCANIGA